jgi:ribosomal protein S15P/S13E
MPRTKKTETKEATKEDISSEKETSKSKKHSESEFEKKVLELAETGLTSEKIGEKLRKEGIHPSEYSKKISIILKDKRKYSNPDLKNIEAKLEKIQKHVEKNKQDKIARREKERVFSQRRRLKAYYKVN